MAKGKAIPEMAKLIEEAYVNLDAITILEHGKQAATALREAEQVLRECYNWMPEDGPAELCDRIRKLLGNG